MARSGVLIIGAGPTGLVLALWLARLGIKPRIIDKTAEPGTTSRALAVHARTLELYRQLELTDAVVEKGHRVPAINLWVEGERQTRVSFEDVGAGLTPYPFLHIFPQDEHERLLIERLSALGITVERRTGLVGYSDEGDRIVPGCADLTGRRSAAKRHILPAVTARARLCGTRGVSVFLAAPISRSSTSLMSRLQVPRSTASCMSMSMKPISSLSFRSPAKVAPG
jgi:2-polyprenyl-6-methoxyphenol hydroxylase-like FAD-dependent oxidoreductase